MKSFFGRLLTDDNKRRVKKIYFKLNSYVTTTFYKYDTEDLKRALLHIGIRKGETLLVHGSFDHHNGFSGTPKDVIDCFLEVLGVNGNLLMVSIPFQTSSYLYLKEDPVFDINRTISRMGIISESFRRKKGVQRSLHPTHPVLAFGKDAAWIVKDHEKSMFPCGENTPFGKFRELNGKVLFFDAPFDTFTFIHYLEDMIKNRAPIPIYRKEAMPARVRDSTGHEMVVQTYVFSDEVVKRRNPKVLEKNLVRNGMLKGLNIGRTRLMLVRSEDAIRCTEEMLNRKSYFYRIEDN